MQKNTAGIVSLLGAAVVPAIFLAVSTPLISSGHAMARIMLVPVFYFFSCMAAIAIGFPTFLLFARLGLIRWWSVVGSGFAVGALAGLIFLGGLTLLGIGLMGAIGVGSALVFWLIFSTLGWDRRASDK